MITVVRKQSKRVTCTRRAMEEIAKVLREGELRNIYPVEYHLCFAAELVKRKENVSASRLNGLCLLQVQNLEDKAKVNETMDRVQLVPYTALAFRGNDQRSVYIVARYTWKEDNSLEMSEEQMQQLHTNAYNQLHYIYSAQLLMSIDIKEPLLRNTCPTAHDPELFYNTNALALAVQEKKMDVPAFKLPTDGKATKTPEIYSSQWEAQCNQYQWAYHKAYTEARQQAANEEMTNEMCLNLLAGYCQQEGLDMEFCISQTCWKSAYWDRKDYVRLAFTTAYEKELSAEIPYGCVDKSALLMMRLEAYLQARYQLRRNRLTGVVEFRTRNHYDYTFRPLTDEELNTMTTDALKMGLQCWDKDLRRMVYSSNVRMYDPLEDYLMNLPAWDGKDHVAELCARIPSDTPNYAYYLHIWMLSMVAHWMGKDNKHGNALVPLLIGKQGDGKTTICNKLLPRELQHYYNDKIDFRTEGDIMSALSNYALINIDEFDSLKKSQQPLLKYLLTKSEVKFRPPYGKAIVERRRYASFIATSNLLHPLQDRTGSRRFACILIRESDMIDYSTPIPYKQLYAQLLAEVNSGMRYWLDDKEAEVLQAQNQIFTHIDSLSEIIDKVFTLPEVGAKESWMSVDAIGKTLCQKYPYLSQRKNLNRDLGTTLKQKDYEGKRFNNGMRYLIVER